MDVWKVVPILYFALIAVRAFRVYKEWKKQNAVNSESN